MSCFDKDDPNRVRIPSPTTKTPKNPFFNREIAQKAGSLSAQTTEAKTQERLRNLLLRHDQRCVFKGTIRATCQVFHFMSDIRNAKTPEKQALRSAVEHTLTRQNFNGLAPFFLNSLPNSKLLESNLHTDLDLYATFCFCVPQMQLFEIQRELIRINALWEKEVNKNPTAKRVIDTRKDPFVIKQLVVIIIRPAMFLPRNERILLLDKSARALVPLDHHGVIPPEEDGDSWKPYGISKTDPSQLADSQGVYWDPPNIMERAVEHALSVFAVIVNAQSKFVGLDNSNVAKIRWEFILESVVNEIFFVPKNFQDDNTQVLPLTISTNMTEQSSTEVNLNTPVADLDTSEQMNPKNASTQNVLHDHNSEPKAWEGSQEDDESSSSSSLDSLIHKNTPDTPRIKAVDEAEPCEDCGPVFDSEDDDDDDDLINGLTPDEMRTLLGVMSDGNASASARVDSALLVLGMAGRPRDGGLLFEGTSGLFPS
ncbi:hypothetical protein B0H11DRAFT_1958535, partial [Mycena galericulata]